MNTNKRLRLSRTAVQVHVLSLYSCKAVRKYSGSGAVYTGSAGTVSRSYSWIRFSRPK